MAGWIGPVVALSLLVIAIAFVIICYVVATAAAQVAERGVSLGRELAQLRADLTPTLEAVTRLSEKGSNVADLAEAEAKEIIATTRQLRTDVKRGIKRAKQRLADFDATIEVVQEQVDSAVVEVSEMMETARASVGMIHQLRRMVRPRRRDTE
jgi:chromosome segregation ATPase